MNEEKKSQSAFIRALEKIHGIIVKGELYFCELFALIVGLLIILQIVRRLIGMQGWPWLDELARYMLVITTFIGSSYAVENNDHMVMDFLFQMLPTRAKFFLQSFVDLFSMVLYGYVGYYAYQWMLKLKKMHRLWESIAVPTWIIWAIVCFALLTMCIRYLFKAVECFRNGIKGKQEFNEIQMKEM